MLLLLLCSATRFEDSGLGWWRRLGGSGAGLFGTTFRIDDAVLRLGKGKSHTHVIAPPSSHHLRQEEDVVHSDELTTWPSLTASFKFSSSSSVWTVSSGSPFVGKRKLQRRPSASYVPARRWSLRRWAQARVEGSKARPSRWLLYLADFFPDNEHCTNSAKYTIRDTTVHWFADPITAPDQCETAKGQQTVLAKTSSNVR